MSLTDRIIWTHGPVMTIDLNLQSKLRVSETCAILRIILVVEASYKVADGKGSVVFQEEQCLTDFFYNGSHKVCSLVNCYKSWSAS